MSNVSLSRHQIYRRVQNGLNWLKVNVDRAKIKNINLDTLNIMSCNQCVLGQVFPDFIDGLEKITGKRVGLTNQEHFNASRLGFGFWASVKGDSCSHQSEQFTQTWKRAIRKFQKAA